VGARGGGDEGAGGAGGCAGEHVQRAERGKHAVGVCDDGREPGAAMMRVLKERVEALANAFNAQEVATTLWKCAKMGREPG
jgi:hypothetical protein